MSTENVVDHGATGDGSTDDAGAFGAAINAAGDGGIVLVPTPAVAYRCKLVHITKSVKILGEGRRPLVERFTPAGNSSIVFQIETDGVTIENLSIDCHATIDFATCIYSNDHDDIVIRDCYLFTSEDPTDAGAPTIHAVALDGCSNALVEGNTTHWTQLKLSGSSDDSVAGPGIRVLNNYGTFCHNAGISCVTRDANACSDVIISGNIMHNTYLGGIYVGADGDTDEGGEFRRLIISDNIVSGRHTGPSGSIGITARVGDVGEDWLIRGNIVVPGSALGVGEEYHTGINVRSTDTAGPGVRITVADNLVSGAGRWGIRCTMAGGQLILTGNQAADDEGILVQADDGDLSLVACHNISMPKDANPGIKLQTLNGGTIDGVMSQNVLGNAAVLDEDTPGSISLQSIGLSPAMEDFSAVVDSLGTATPTIPDATEPTRRAIVFLDE